MKHDLATRILWGVIILLGGFFFGVFWFIPVSFSLDDAGRYYALTHFLLTGEHIPGTYLKAFNEPSQFYALFSYPFVLYLVKQLGVLIGIHWIWLMKGLHLVIFVASARLMYQLTRIYSSQ